MPAKRGFKMLLIAEEVSMALFIIIIQLYPLNVFSPNEGDGHDQWCLQGQLHPLVFPNVVSQARHYHSRNCRESLEHCTKQTSVGLPHHL